MNFLSELFRRRLKIKRIALIFISMAGIALMVSFHGNLFSLKKAEEKQFIKVHAMQQPLLLMNRQIVTGAQLREAIQEIAQEDSYGEYMAFPIQIVKVKNPFTLDMENISKREFILTYLSTPGSSCYLAADERYEIKISHKEDATIRVLVARQLP